MTFIANNIESEGYITGATITATTIYANTISATTISASTFGGVNYIDFNGLSGVTSISGRTYYDATENALSYKPNTPAMDVTLNIGQEQLIYVKNISGALIPNGAACHISGSTGNKPTIQLAIATNIGDESFVSGIATHDIAHNAFGFITNFGIVRDIIITGGTAGNNIYLSAIQAGGFVYNTSGLTNASRVCKLGRIITTGVTGSILVNIVNEFTDEILTIKEKNLLVNNSLSTGVYLFTGITKTSSTTFKIAPVSGWVVKNAGIYALNPLVVNVLYSGQTGLTTPYLNTANETHVLITTANTISYQVAHPTAQERRDNIFLGTIAHPDRIQIIQVINTPDFDVAPISQLRDMMQPINLINEGVIASSNGVGLTFKTSAGNLYGMGINWSNNELAPNTVVITASTPTAFRYTTQLSGFSATTTAIIPSNYDVAGVVTAIPGGPNVSTNQRIYLFPDNTYRVQYGQTTYTTLTNAITGLDTETYTISQFVDSNAILIGILSVRNGATDLSSATDAKFTFSSKFGEVFGGTGGISNTTLQQTYNNSTTPEIIINSTLDGLSIQNGTGNADNITKLLEGQNTAGVQTSFIRADGGLSATTITATSVSATTYLNLPIDIRVTGGTYAAGTATFTNNTGGTFSVTGFGTGGPGGSGASVTAFTYNNNNLFTIQDSSGFTYSALASVFSAITATTISAATYNGNGSNLTGVAHAFTGTSTLDFDSYISGETNYTTTAITNSNINSSSTVMVRVIPSVNHPNVDESMLDGLTFTQSNIVDGVGFDLDCYATQDTWGIYNIVYRIIN